MELLNYETKKKRLEIVLKSPFYIEKIFLLSNALNLFIPLMLPNS